MQSTQQTSSSPSLAHCFGRTISLQDIQSSEHADPDSLGRRRRSPPLVSVPPTLFKVDGPTWTEADETPQVGTLRTISLPVSKDPAGVEAVRAVFAADNVACGTARWPIKSLSKDNSREEASQSIALS